MRVMQTLMSARRVPARLALFLVLLVLGSLPAAHAQRFSRMIVFGDSLSDVGNDADVSDDDFHVRVPGSTFNYTNGRFTSGSDTTPAATLHGGVWHEQLAKVFLGMTAATASLDGGLDYAYGGATTEDGTRTLDFTSNIGITVNNMGQQVDDFLSKYTTVDGNALVIVWGGANDIFVSDPSAAALLATGTAAADREVALINRLAQAGGTTFLVPNLPPIGNTPRYNTSAGDTAAYNAACQAFGTELNSQLDTLEANLATQGLAVTIYRLDVYGLFTRLLANQQAYNFYNITQSAQGESVKADNYLFWDDVHPTASGHYQLAIEALTLLNGTPVVQVAPDFTADGIWVTRSGTDISTALSVPYKVAGSAVPGVDYTPLKGHKNIKAGKQSVKINIPAIDGGSSVGKAVALIIAAGDDFTVGTVVKAKIKYGQPIQSTNAINTETGTPRIATKTSLMLPGSK